MSRKCELSVMKSSSSQRVYQRAIERSKLTKKTLMYSYPNLVNKSFDDNIFLGKVSLKISNRTLRTIYFKYKKYNNLVSNLGILETFLLFTKPGHLSDLGKELQNNLFKKSLLKPWELKKEVLNNNEKA